MTIDFDAMADRCYDRGRQDAIEACAAIAYAIMSDADCKAADLTYGELYGMNCRSDAAQEIAKAILALGQRSG